MEGADEAADTGGDVHDRDAGGHREVAEEMGWMQLTSEGERGSCRGLGCADTFIIFQPSKDY